MERTYSRRFRYSLIFLLAMSEIMPVMLLGQTLPILLRRGGATMDEVGLLYLVMSPWALKFLWAPLIDQFGSSNGRYRGWLLIVHPILISLVVVLSVIDFPALFFSDRTLAMSLLALLTFVCATADTAADGLVMRLLPPQERGVGNGYQMAGTMMGNFVGGGLLLLLLPQLGWHWSCGLLALLLLVPYVSVWRYQEPPQELGARLSLREVVAPFRHKKLGGWLVLLACIEASYAMAYTPMQAILSDRGYSLEEVGVIMGILGSIAGILGSIAGAFCIERLGRRRSFFGFAVLTALGSSFLILAAQPLATRWLVYSSIELMIFSLMALGTVMYTMMMDRARKESAASDYTVQYCALQLASFTAMAMGGYLTESYGKGVVFGVTPLLMLLVFGFAARYLSQKDFSVEPL